MKRDFLTISVLLALVLLPAAAQADPPPDFVSRFDADLENWRATDAGSILTWRATDRNPAGQLRATGPGRGWPRGGRA